MSLVYYFFWGTQCRTVNPRCQELRLCQETFILSSASHYLDLWPLTSWPQIDCFVSSLRGLLCQLASKSLHSFTKCHVYKFGSRRTDGLTDERTDRLTDGRTDSQTNGHVENIIVFACLSVACIYTLCLKKGATFIFATTLANLGRF